MGTSSGAFTLEFTIRHQLEQSALNGTQTQRGAKLTDALFVKAADFVHRSASYRFECRKLCLHQRKSIIKITIGRQYGTQQIFDKRNDILAAFVPSMLRLMWCCIIQILVLSNFCFLFADIETAAVK